MRAAPAIAALLTILLAEPALARSRLVDADPTEASYYSSRHHRHGWHYRHSSRHHSHPIRVHSDPPGIRWTELPAEAPEPEPTPKPDLPSHVPIIKVHTEALPATTPIFQSRHLLPPSLPTIAPAQARAYCITHGLGCAPPVPSQ